MTELHHIFAVLNAGVSALALAVALVAWRRRSAPGAPWIAVVMLGCAIWAGAAAMMWYVPTLSAQVFWLKVTFAGVAVIPVGTLILAFVIARMERWYSPRSIALWWAVAAAILGIRLLNPGHLYDVAFVAQTMGPYTHFESIPGPLYHAYNVLAFTMIGVGLAILLRVALRSYGSERAQAATLFVGGLMPFIASAVNESRVIPLAGLDLGPPAFLGTGVLWLIAVFGGSLFDVVPVARGVLVEQMSDGVVVLDADDRVVDANPAALTMLQAVLAETLGKPVGAVMGGVDGAVALLDGGGERHATLRMRTDGDLRYVDVDITPLVVGHGYPARLVILHDVTAEQRANEGLRLARIVFDAVNEGIVVMLPNENQQVIDVNEAFCRLTGRTWEDSVGADLSWLQSDRHPPEFYETMRQTLFAEGGWQGEVWQTRVDGIAFPAWLSLSLAKDGEGRAAHIVGIFTDITEMGRKADEKFRHYATHDALTGLPNSLLLDDRLEHALSQARRAHDGLAVLFIDLDQFRNVNDSLGHAHGDDVLIEVARRISPLLREGDTVARPGGDEFTIVLSNVKDCAQAEVTARRLLGVVAAPYRLGDGDLHLSACVGIAVFPADGTDAPTLMKHADIAMHRAKGLGRGRSQCFSEEFREGLDRRMIVEKELWGADEDGRYFLHYQPQVDLATGRIAGVEALVRLRARDGAVVSPTEFVPVAEDSDLIFQLGEWVLRQACADLAILHEVAPDLTMSVNFSARQFSGTDVSLLHEVLRTSGVDARFLVVEITETALLSDPEEAAARLAELRGVEGLQLSLDDFGTGYSSLSYARMLHADAIKVDRSFVELLPDDSGARAIVLSTIALAKSLHAKVVAEGPETVEQVRFLRANGCDQAQGYYFSRPIPRDELMLLLRQGPFSLPDVENLAAQSE